LSGMSPVAAEVASGWSAPGPGAGGVGAVVTGRVLGGAVVAGALVDGLVVDCDTNDPPQPASPSTTLRKATEWAMVRGCTPRTLAE
jgi:hypothetical protein